MPAGETEQSPSAWTIDSTREHLLDVITAFREWVRDKFHSHEHAVTTALEAHDRMLAEMDRRYEQRFVAQEKAVELALARVDKEFHEHFQQVREETHAALDAADKAINKSEVATEKRFESVNEFRGQLADQAQRFMPRLEAEQRIAQNAEKITALENRHGTDVAQINSRLDLNAGSSTGADKFRATMIALAGAAVGIIGLVAALLTR